MEQSLVGQSQCCSASLVSGWGWGLCLLPLKRLYGLEGLFAG